MKLSDQVVVLSPSVAKKTIRRSPVEMFAGRLTVWLREPDPTLDVAVSAIVGKAPLAEPMKKSTILRAVSLTPCKNVVTSFRVSSIKGPKSSEGGAASGRFSAMGSVYLSGSNNDGT
jgi:hypothetical protein